MSGPWLKFYPTDWRADPALRMCSMAARGLWLEMLCVMHEAEPYGSLRVNGKPVTDRQLAGLIGIPSDQTLELLAELQDAGVFSRDEDGAVISRRMQRDKAKAETDKANGKRGGNPNLTEGVNPPVNGEDKAQKPDTRYQKETPDGVSRKREIEREFHEEFWPLYPLKRDKGHALKAFISARKRVDLASIMAGARRYAAEREGQESKYTKHAQGWLNGDGWADEPPASKHSPPAVDPSASESRWRARMIVARRGRTWSTPEWGPAPGLPGCMVPGHMIEPGDGEGWTETQQEAA